MSPSRTFILRPIATTLLVTAVVLLGAIGYLFLPVAALPDVDFPTIQVVTGFPGASPEVMATSVTAPLEHYFGQIAGQSWRCLQPCFQPAGQVGHAVGSGKAQPFRQFAQRCLGVREQRDAGDIELHRALGVAHRLIDGEAVDARHRSNRRARIVAIDHEERRRLPAKPRITRRRRAFDADAGRGPPRYR